MVIKRSSSFPILIQIIISTTIKHNGATTSYFRTLYCATISRHNIIIMMGAAASPEDSFLPPLLFFGASVGAKAKREKRDEISRTG